MLLLPLYWILSKFFAAAARTLGYHFYIFVLLEGTAGHRDGGVCPELIDRR